MAVKLESFKGRLRLRWSHQGKRYHLSLGLDDTSLGRTVAKGRVSQLEADLTSGNFDRTLAKYKPEVKLSTIEATVTAVELMNRFTLHRTHGIDKRTKGKYKAIGSKVASILGDACAAVDDSRAEAFRLELSKTLAPNSQKEYLSMISLCWRWGVGEGLVSVNPWHDVLKRVKVPPMKKPRPFLKPEVTAILDGFRNNKRYRHYGDFVEFLFSTGCRIGEVIGLRWGHLSDDFDKVWIGESVSRGVRKSTKTNKSREFRLNPRLSSMLRARCPADADPDALIFTGPRGGSIDDNNFRNKPWKTILEEAGVSYRKPYNTRHTFISHALASGLSPMTIAQMTGHDPETLFKYYAADIQRELQLPTFF